MGWRANFSNVFISLILVFVSKLIHDFYYSTFKTLIDFKMKRRWAHTRVEADEPSYGQLGIIESVHLRNFMCHDNLSFNFDQHINFIIGRNGSGKSAVLTGIILALGGKSGTTGRYSSLKGFIKTGKTSATVSVTLRNCGPEAYKPEEFGKKITVERSFDDTGKSAYKLKSEQGRVVSTSKEELTNILSVMDIQIGNPITVLTQETSRNFLLSKKPDKLFDLFYKGTGLAKVHDDYNRAVQQKTDAKNELQSKKAVLPEMEKDVKKLKALLDKSSKVNELKKELLWAQVIEFERKRDATQEIFDKVKAEVSELEGKIKGYQADLVTIGQTIRTGQTEKRDANDKMEAIRKDFSELGKKKSAHADIVREMRGKYSSHEREVKRLESEIQGLENIINDIRLKNESELHEDKLRHEMVINNIKNQIQQANNRLELLLSEKNALREAHAATVKKIDNCQAELGEINYEKSKIEREKQQLIEGMNNRITVFGREMINVLKDIKSAVKAGKFKKEPKGPIGLYITVKDPKWSFAVQECLKKNFLRTFLCDNYADTEELTSILKKHYQRNSPGIITSQFTSKVYDVTPHKTVCEHPTVLDMLKIDDPVITNCLIDQVMIENILLIEDPDAALNLMLYKPPQKCRHAYTPNGDQYCHTPFRNYSCRNLNQVSMLKRVNEDDIKRKDEELRNRDQQYAEKLCDKANVVQQLKKHEQDISNKDQEIAQLKIKMNQLHAKLQEETNTYEEPKDINCLHNDLVILQQEKQRHEASLAACASELLSKTAELETLSTNLVELKKNLHEETQNFHVLSEKVEELLSKKEKLENLTIKYKDKLKHLEPKLKECEKELANEKACVEVATTSALKSGGPRIDTRRSTDTIRQIVKETEEFIRKQKNCDREALLHEYEEKVQSLQKATQELRRQEGINKRLDSMMAKRFVEFQKICKNTSVSLTCCFVSYLRENNFDGYPEVNFDKRTLDIFVQPEKSKSKVGSKYHNLSQLSGGERSYVTISLLLSLWDRIHMPFRILDEYDVFMDSNNRHLSITMLIQAAMTNKRVQFIFLSPLELPQVENAEGIKIHKMPDPRK